VKWNPNGDGIADCRVSKGDKGCTRVGSAGGEDAADKGEEFSEFGLGTVVGIGFTKKVNG